jgi:DNA-directed RNA polymerase subunit RPC12/RpoP
MNDFFTLTCPSCGANVTVIENTNRYRCEYCGNEHLVRNPAMVQPVAQSTPIRPKVPIPPSVWVKREGQSARIVKRWFSLKYIPMAFFCVAWDAFLFFWYSMALGTHAPWIFVVFPIAHLAVGVGLSYSTLAGFLNRTFLEVTKDEVAVWFEPLPWMGEKTIKTRDLKQLYCKEKVTRGKNSDTYTYELFAVTTDDRQVNLLSNLESPDIALFFEQQIETWLRIQDQPVVGEIRR